MSKCTDNAAMMAHYLMLLRTFQRPYQYANVTTFAISDDFKAS